MSDAELERMTIVELEDLKERAKNEIRARIRANREAKGSGTQPGSATAARDLQSDFNAWKKGRR